MTEAVAGSIDQASQALGACLRFKVAGAISAHFVPSVAAKTSCDDDGPSVLLVGSASVPRFPPNIVADMC